MPSVERLQMIQTVIDRMARNSFALKGWSITLVVALLGLAVSQSDAVFALFALYVVVCFAGLDAFYLAIERRYRALYEVAATEEGGWSLAAGRTSGREVVRAVRSPSVYPFYGLALVVALVAVVSVG
jgi:hypothetical protein